MASISALPKVVNSGWQANKNEYIFLAHRPQIARVHKICWKDEKSSRDWLKRIREMNSAFLSLNASESTNYLDKLVQDGNGTQESSNDSINTFEERPVNLSNKTDESCLSRKPISQSLHIPDGPQGRKPNSEYIGSISRIDANVAICFSEISKKSYSDETLTASLFLPKNGKFATKHLLVNDLSPQEVFFPSEVNLQAKRKLSFEYIQEVSMLQYGHNSVENGNFRR